MELISRETRLRANELWVRKKPFDCGKYMFQNLPLRSVAAYCGGMIEFGTSLVGHHFVYGQDDLYWMSSQGVGSQLLESKSIFNRLRKEVLRLEEGLFLFPKKRTRLVYLLFLENVAKSIYNAAEIQDEFDEDSPIWAVQLFWQYQRRLRSTCNLINMLTFIESKSLFFQKDIKWVTTDQRERR